MIKSDDRLYAIKPDEVYFSAGVTNKVSRYYWDCIAQIF